MYPATLGLVLVAICVFVPIFAIALFILKSAGRAFSIAAVFALGSVLGWCIAGYLAQAAVGRAVSPEVRDAFGAAFSTGGAVAGGVLAVWLLTRKTGIRP